MTLRRCLVLTLALVLAAAVPLGEWGQRSVRLSDERYIDMALQRVPLYLIPAEVRPGWWSARVERRNGWVTVHMDSSDGKARVVFDATTGRVTSAVRDPR